MSRFASDDDKWDCQLIDRWIEDARGAIDDIGMWRDASAEDRLWGYGRPDPPNSFFGDTQRLVGMLVRDYPQLDPRPLSDINAAVTTWFLDYRGDNISPQSVLWATLDRAVMAILVIREGIMRRVIREPAESDCSRRPAYGRDHLFLAWSAEGMKPAAIRDRWNAMPDAERKEVCPKCWQRLSEKSGRDTIKESLKKASSEKKL